MEAVDIWGYLGLMTVGPENTPFQLLGGEAEARRLALTFYRVMAETEPALAKLHATDADGRVSEKSQERFALFLVEWLGGPKVFSSEFGHPRLRMRHARVPVDSAMRDAWLRCMERAMDEVAVGGELRSFLSARFLDVANFLRNTEDP